MIGGEALVILDPSGRLRRLKVIPAAESPPSRAINWAALVQESGFDLSAFKSVPSRWRPPVFADQRSAWEEVGVSKPLRIEAAAAGGAPVWFAILRKDERPAHAIALAEEMREQAFWWILILFFLIVALAGVFLAVRNVRAGRSDRRGAMRLSLFIIAAMILGWAIGGHHVAARGEFAILVNVLSWAVLYGAFVGVLYLALEPVVRSRLPQRIVSWNRLMAGDFRDPMIGRDLLVGIAGGLGMYAVILGNRYLRALEHGRDWDLNATFVPALSSGRELLYRFLGGITPGSILVPFASLVFIVLLSVVLRRMHLGAIAFWLLYGAVLSLRGDFSVVQILPAFVQAAFFTFVVYRVGLIARIAAHYALLMSISFPLLLNFSAWYAPISLLSIGIIVAAALYGFVISLGSRAPWLSEESLLPP